MWIDVLHRIKAVFRRQRVEQELNDELQFHIQRQTEKYTSAGWTPEEAARRARLDFGGLDQVKEQYRDSLGVSLVERTVQDLTYAGRMMWRTPGFSALAVLIMALGIGANTAVFSVVNAVLLKPLSYNDPDRIVTLSNVSPPRAASTALSKQISIPDFQDWRDQSSSFDAMTYYGSRETAVIAGSVAEYSRVASVSPEFFRVFNVEPIAGRFFTDQEMQPGSGGAALISYRYWQSRFAGDPRTLGQTLRIISSPRQIVGILPPGFQFPQDTDVWLPAIAPPGERTGQNYLAVARLRADVPLDRAQSEMTLIARRLEQQYPESNIGRGVAVARMRDEMVGNVRVTLYLLLGAVALVLLIACANTATLLLGKATTRTREVALRAALGASRRRIVRQLVTESLLLAFIAGGFGLVLAYGGSRTLVALAPADLPRLAEAGIDRWVLGFTVMLSIITSLVFGLVPALSASALDLNDTLKQGAKGSVSIARSRLRGILTVAEVAVAVVLLSGAGLLIKSFIQLQNVALGFRPENVLVMRATVPVQPSVSIVRARQFFKDALSEISTLSGVAASGATMAPPGNVDSTGAYFVDRLPPKSDWAKAPSVVLSIVAPGTFQALGIPLKSGRDFREADALDRPFVAVVNETLVRKSFPNQNPLGRTIYCSFDSLNAMTIIGVVGDVRQRGPERESMPECYMPYLQHAFNGGTLSVVVKTTGDPNGLTPALRRLAAGLSPDVPMKFTTMEAILSDNVATPRFRTLLFTIFAGLAICLAMAGVYGVMAYAVSQRSKEIGVRMALGATSASVLGCMIRQGLALTGLGLIIGIIVATTGTRLLTSILFQVQPNDPVVYVAVVLFVGIAALLASYLPARRASRIDPLAAIRQE